MAFGEMNADSIAQSMLNGFDTMVRDKLRERIMERIEPDIQAAIDGAMETFRASVDVWKDPQFMRQVIQLTINDKRTKADE